MTWIKICGTTNADDALLAAEAGADAVGFIFYGESARNIGIETAREIVEKLPEDIEKVGVFVDAERERIRETVFSVGLTAVQLHGKGSQESVWNDPRPAIECVGASKLISMVPGDALKNAKFGIEKRIRESVFALLLDSQRDRENGGTGTTFDWEATCGMVQAVSLTVPVIVAGGLTASNVFEALRLFQPFGVDVASGIEARPGIKDPEKLRAFVKAVREADRKTS